MTTRWTDEHGHEWSITDHWCRLCGKPLIPVDGSDAHPGCECGDVGDPGQVRDPGQNPGQNPGQVRERDHGYHPHPGCGMPLRQDGTCIRCDQREDEE